MKYKILIVLFVFLLFTGCKVELPEQAAVSASAVSAADSALSSPREASSAEDASSAQSEAASQADSSQAASKDTPPASAAAVSSASSAKAAPHPAASPSSQAPKDKGLTCSLSISCSDILAHKDRFTPEQLEAVPADGAILQESNISFQTGETVFQVLLRETKRLKIPMDHMTSPAFQTEYVSGIGNIYEKAYGTSSGWLFAVNGKQPAVGCSAYKLKSGDKIQWIFDCAQ